MRLRLADGLLTAERDASSVLGLLHREGGGRPERLTWVCPVERPIARAVGAGAAPRNAWPLDGLRPVEVDETTPARANGFATRLLWFAHHGLTGRYPPRLEAKGWSAYRQLNEAVAEGVCAQATGSDPVLVNDYQLALVPGLVRRRRAAARIAHMSYTAFAAPDSWQSLPRDLRIAIVDGMLAADLLGFAAPRWAANFAAAVESDGRGRWDAASGTVEHRGGRSRVRVYPLRVNRSEVERKARRGLERWGGTLRSPHCEHLFARTDRLDPAKNIEAGFAAFELLLRRNPGWRGRVRFSACLSPTRLDVPEYRAYARSIERTVARINDRYPESIALHRGEDHERALALLSVADATLVNSHADGMNLVAQEAALVGEANVLVLSRNTGSADLLRDAPLLLEEPGSVEETADRLSEAVTMPESERLRRAAALAALLRDDGPALLDRLLDDLSAA